MSVIVQQKMCVHACVCLCVSVCACPYVYVCICVCMCVCACACVERIRKSKYSKELTTGYSRWKLAGIHYTTIPSTFDIGHTKKCLNVTFAFVLLPKTSTLVRGLITAQFCRPESLGLWTLAGPLLPIANPPKPS